MIGRWDAVVGRKGREGAGGMMGGGGLAVLCLVAPCRWSHDRQQPGVRVEWGYVLGAGAGSKRACAAVTRAVLGCWGEGGTRRGQDECSGSGDLHEARGGIGDGGVRWQTQRQQ